MIGLEVKDRMARLTWVAILLAILTVDLMLFWRLS